MLATGEIPGLIAKEDKDVISLECKNVWTKEAGAKGQEPSILTSRCKVQREISKVPLTLLPVLNRLVLTLARGCIDLCIQQIP